MPTIANFSPGVRRIGPRAFEATLLDLELDTVVVTAGPFKTATEARNRAAELPALYVASLTTTNEGA